MIDFVFWTGVETVQGVRTHTYEREREGEGEKERERERERKDTNDSESESAKEQERAVKENKIDRYRIFGDRQIQTET